MFCQKTFHFDASHIVFGSQGLCGKLHGHTFQVTVTMIGDPEPDSGVIVSPAYLKAIVMPVITRLNGQHLNYILRVPTVENITLYIAHALYAQTDEKLSSVKVEVPSLMSYEWSVTSKDEELFTVGSAFVNGKFVHNTGWHDAFDPIPAFASHKARAQWVSERYANLYKHYRAMHTVGAELVAFERYKASLDADEAARLLAELKNYGVEEEPAELVEKEK